MKRIVLGGLLVISVFGCSPTIRQLTQEEIDENCNYYAGEAKVAGEKFMDSVNSIGTSFNDGLTSHRGDELQEAKDNEQAWCHQTKAGSWVKEEGNTLKPTSPPSKN